MCVGIPMLVLSVDGIAARATDGDVEALIDLTLTGPLAAGTWVLTHLGAAREVLDEAEAVKIAAAVRALKSIMAGGGMGDAFADLEARPPALPPHLQAARAAGKTTA